MPVLFFSRKMNFLLIKNSFWKENFRKKLKFITIVNFNDKKNSYTELFHIIELYDILLLSFFTMRKLIVKISEKEF